MLALETDRVDAYSTDHILLFGLKANAKDPAALEVVGESLQVEPYACMVRKDDPKFKALVDGAVNRFMGFTFLHTERLSTDGNDDRQVIAWAKTGTADAPDIIVDPDGEEGPLAPVVARTGDHSWFVVLAGPEGGEPRYAIAVMMEYAGSGGRVSGPIANQIVHALKHEGYL